MAVDRANFVPICSFRKGKGLFSYENKPFLHPFGGDKRDRTADLSGGKRRKARRRRVLIEMQEVSGVQTCRFHQMKKAAFRLPRSFGGDKRDRTADLLNAIERLATFYSRKVHEIANIKSY